MFYNFSIIYDPISHQIRCQRYIINLLVNSFLFVTDNKILENNKNFLYVEQFFDQIRNFKKYGPPGMFYNIIVRVVATARRHP
jgi:hypothetical protein